jgi:elongation factor Ts
MTQITPQMVKELREKTGAGMGDCKNALVESNGDMKLAIEILRRKGAASAAKRAEREAKEGIIAIAVSPNHKKASIVEINCETDFVARNENFVNYANVVVNALLNNNVATLDELMNCKYNDDTIQGIHNEILAKFQENIQIRRFETIETDGYISDYVHAGSKLGVLVVFEFDKQVDNFTEQAKQNFRDIAMQIAAMNPMYIDRNAISPEVIQKELAIYTEQAINEGKKPEIAERIAKGKLEKFFQEQCLVEQTFIKDGNLSVKDYLGNVEKSLGIQIKIQQFRRYYLGEVE